jgi:CBS domain-containing protein
MHRPRVILVEEDGRLVGLVTKKDVLKAVHRKRRYQTHMPTPASPDTSPLLRSPTVEFSLAHRIQAPYVEHRQDDEEIEL